MRGTASKPPTRSVPGYFHHLTELASLHRYWFKVHHSRSLRPRFVHFNERLFDHLATIQHRLRDGHFEFGPYQFFMIREKKMRSIANAPLKDRIVHWLLYEHLMTHWMRRFIHDSYGNLPGRGTHAAVHKLANWAHKPYLEYALQIDIAKYFSSVQHAYLKRVLLEREGDQNIRQLLNDLVESYQTGPEFDHLFDNNSPYRQIHDKGMPLGNLTSQFFANIYLNEFDHWIKEVLQIKHYIRYVDDMVVLGKSPDELKIVRDQMLAKLATIGLTVNPKKISIRQIDKGIPFLGYIVWNCHISAGKYVRNRYGKMLRHSIGKNVHGSLASYRGILSHTGVTR